MTTVLALTALGFFLGMRHAADADHVIAVSTIVARQKTLRGGVLIGVVWGLGHTLTIVVVGAAIILFGVVITPAVGLTMEMTVALMLVALGLWNLAGFFQAVRTQLGGGDRHAHAHDRHLGGLGVYQLVRPLVVGVVHGLAGSAAIALLVLATIGEPRWALAYLLLFGIGTIVGMMLVTLVVAAPVTYASGRLRHADRHLRLASGLLSLGFGLFLAYHIGVVGGLFALWGVMP